MSSGALPVSLPGQETQSLQPIRLPAPFGDRVRQAVERTQEWLLARQAPEGYWVGELEGDTILESEYLLLLTWLGQENSETARQAGNYILQQQLPEGGWAIYPGGPLEISASVKAYLALKILGHCPESEYMLRAKQAIRDAGGAEKVNSFTRYYFALLGIIGYHQCPAVPPELLLIPHWLPFNIYEMSSWSRTIIIPLTILWAFRPVRQLPEEMRIPELFLNGPENLPVTMDKSAVVDDLRKQTRLDWEGIFRAIDLAWKRVESLGVKPLRRRALKQAEEWMLKRFEQSDGLGAIFPPIIWSVVALRCLGYAEDAPEIRAAMHELEKLSIHEGDTLRLQPCKSPVWDTGITLNALRESGVPAEHPALQNAIEWLLSKEVRVAGDWSARDPHTEPGGWYFEFNNAFYPDVDDTIMVTMGLAKCLPEVPGYSFTERLLEPGRLPNAALLSEKIQGVSPERREQTLRILESLKRGVNWTLSMQCRNGGWAAFDRDNTRELFTRVPFADHNAMIDPPTADISARVLEMFGTLEIQPDEKTIQRALDFIWSEQEPDGAWYGRWGVHYIYGTWQVLVGLTKLGVSAADPRIRQGVQWLQETQQPCGGWGETPRAYDDPSLRGQGHPTPSQTAWALMGLMAAGEADSPAVRRGVEYLLSQQNDDGGWDEDWYTGTGFPKVFYLKYHLYKIYFPLLALSRYARSQSSQPARDILPFPAPTDRRA